jgi:hypothetical protein
MVSLKRLVVQSYFFVVNIFYCLDMQLVRTGFFHELVPVLVKKRMQLALTLTSSDLASLKSNIFLLVFVGLIGFY